jgi:hypothetical protein
MLTVNHSIPIVCPRCTLVTHRSLYELAFTQTVRCPEPCNEPIPVADQYEVGMRDLTERFGDSRNFWGVNDKFDTPEHEEAMVQGARQERMKLGLS